MNTTTQSNEKVVQPVVLPVDLRDWFAGQALAGWLANYSPEMSYPAGRNFAADIAELSYEMADEMLKARETNHD